MSSNEQWRCPVGDQGSVLILALWVIFMLAMLAVAVGAHIDGRLALARRMEQRTVGYAAARVGMERGIAQLLQDTNAWDGPGEAWSDSPSVYSNVVSGAGVFSLYYVVERSGGGSNVIYGLRDEQSKIDLNQARIELITALLEVAGGLSPEAAARLGETIKVARTRPVDKFPGIGRQSGWVDPQSEPGPLKSIYELRWVKGLSEDVFEKIQPYVTVYGKDRVNLNSAGQVVLQCMGMRAGSGGAKVAQNLARKILQFRERGGIFKSYHGDALAEVMGEEIKLTDDERRLLSGSGMKSYVTVASDHFSGHSEGWMASGSTGQRRRLDFVWDRKERKFEFWHED